MTEAQIEDMIEHFGDAVNRAIQAGFDGVEIHGANTFLIQQFFSPHSNRRNDKWGGDIEKRTTFPVAILEKTKAVAAASEKSDFIWLTTYVSAQQTGHQRSGLFAFLNG